MSEIVKFAPVKSVSVELKDPGPSTHLVLTLTATGLVSRDMYALVSLLPEDQTQKEWFSMPAVLGRVEVKALQSFDIPVTVDIPAGTPFAKHGFKVLVADEEKPEQEFSTSPIITVERKQAVPHDRSWWMWVALGVGVVAVTAIALIFLLRPKLGDSCDPAQPHCPPSARCPAESHKCTAPKNLACQKNEHCLSNKCKDGVCAPALLGDDCYPSESVCEGSDAAACLKKTRKCASLQGGPCRTVADCVDGACTKSGGRATFLCGDPVGQSGCENNQQCPANQVCANVDGAKVCLFRGGVSCAERDGSGGGKALCASQRCNDKALCAPDDGSCVPENHDCGINLCVNNRCVAPDGAVVTAVWDRSALLKAALRFREARSKQMESLVSRAVRK
jgi:hypothetical protein